MPNENTAATIRQNMHPMERMMFDASVNMVRSMLSAVTQSFIEQNVPTSAVLTGLGETLRVTARAVLVSLRRDKRDEHAHMAMEQMAQALMAIDTDLRSALTEDLP